MNIVPDIAIENHRAWLGLLQPVGLVVSPPALVQAQAVIDRNIGDLPLRIDSLLTETGNGEWILPAENNLALFTELLQWRPNDLIEVDGGNVDASIYLDDYDETFSADYITKHRPTDEEALLFIFIYPEISDFDEVSSERQGWQASLQAKVERLLREKNVPIGLIVGRDGVRLVYAPKGESSGHLTFPFGLMKTIAGRSVLRAFEMLLGEERLFSLPSNERLPGLLSASRQYQNVVSTQLAEQVLAALYELIRGIQAANARRNGELLQIILDKNPNDIYHASITVLMRMVFILFAEDRDLIPNSEVYATSYSLKGLFEKLREDEARFQDSMDQRYGAWAQLLVLNRLLYNGIETQEFTLPARHGHLFDPDRFSFLEGRTINDGTINPPLISDGVIFRVLNNLMVLNGERISYRALDVEQIGSVYETVMGFQLQIAEGLSLALKPTKPHGAPVHINLEELLRRSASERKKYLKSVSDHNITGDSLANAQTIEELEAALDRKVARAATPNIVPKGSLILQPSDARRKSGSHYTPRSLTEPIVRKALEPIIYELGSTPKPEQILELKVCDPAMGSGAFLVEATRQLSELLVESWHRHKIKLAIPIDEDELLYARRLIVQKCIYGVDKNPMAVDLAKLSLWLATFARDHAFTFLDHALKTGDSLVGLSLNQISSLTWESGTERGIIRDQAIRVLVNNYLEIRSKIRSAQESESYDGLVALNTQADTAVTNIRYVADLIIATWFSETTDRARRAKLEEVEVAASNLIAANAAAKTSNALPEGLSSFHWELEYPEVFDGDTKGFDTIVGNPPFLGGGNISGLFGGRYRDWICSIRNSMHGNGDLAGHFFRRSYELIKTGGTIGLIATNSISQGDTRDSSLTPICIEGGTIYSVVRRMRWPGIAAVVVSIVHIAKGATSVALVIDGTSVSRISAFLFPGGQDASPVRLLANKDRSFNGMKIYGQGFLFDDSDTQASSLLEMNTLIENQPRNAERIHPYIGGEEINSHPFHKFHRYVIDFFDFSLEKCSEWPELLEIVRKKVKPERDRVRREALKRFWWQYGEKRPALRKSLSNCSSVLVNSQVSANLSFAFIPASWFPAHSLNIFPREDYHFFCVLQSRPHEVWARFFGSSLEDRLRYTPTDCFETFPFPENYEADANMEAAGREYYEFRAALMARNDEGLTKTYNRFHDPNESSEDIKKLRDLHAAMDHAVLDTYGWSDIKTDCEFFLDYEDDDEDENTTGRRQRRKPWRYRWPDDVRDEVLARLLNLNEKRAEAERLAGITANDSSPKKKKAHSRKKKT